MIKPLKFGIILLILLSITLFAVIIIDVPGTQGASDRTESPVELPDGETDVPDLTLAVENALESATGQWQIFEYQVDHIQVQDDGQMAIVWLGAADPETGEFLAREPELALAVLDESNNWQVLLEDNPKFIDAFTTFQYAEKSIQGDLIPPAEALPKSEMVFGGYYLPWAEGLEKRLTWSVGHTSCTPTYYCTHAFDFADGTMFPIMAAKGGTVYHWRDSCPNNTPNCTNSITLQDRSTTPWTYQIYLHIAQNSVPAHLKQVGTPVLQGQFIANVDNTGYSTGHHLHFMVVSENTRYFSGGMQSVWGVAEDITFRDVSINWHAPTQGGRPRLAYEAASYGGVGQTYYISGNKPAVSPTGGLTAPATKTYVTNRNLTVSGWGQENVGLAKLEILANYDGAWVQIGSEQTTTSFTTTVDLCKTSIPNGPFQLALRAWDNKGNPSGILTPRKLIKGVECGTTGTSPSVNITENGGIVALPESGYVTATVARGSTNSSIASVEFWFHGLSWTKDSWVYLGKDTSSINGWRAPINTSGLTESDKYTIVAVVTDAAGNQGTDLTFKAMIDRTVPWIEMDTVPSPVTSSTVTISWTGGDALAGLDHYSLAVNINGTHRTLAPFLTTTVTTYTIPVEKEQLLAFSLTAYDKAGNQNTSSIAMYTEGYEFEFGYTYPLFIEE